MDGVIYLQSITDHRAQPGKYYKRLGLEDVPAVLITTHWTKEPNKILESMVEELEASWKGKGIPGPAPRRYDGTRAAAWGIVSAVLDNDGIDMKQGVKSESKAGELGFSTDGRYLRRPMSMDANPTESQRNLGSQKGGNSAPRRRSSETLSRERCTPGTTTLQSATINAKEGHSLVFDSTAGDSGASKGGNSAPTGTRLRRSSSLLSISRPTGTEWDSDTHTPRRSKSEDSIGLSPPPTLTVSTAREDTTHESLGPSSFSNQTGGLSIRTTGIAKSKRVSTFSTSMVSNAKDTTFFKCSYHQTFNVYTPHRGGPPNLPDTNGAWEQAVDNKNGAANQTGSDVHQTSLPTLIVSEELLGKQFECSTSTANDFLCHG